MNRCITTAILCVLILGQAHAETRGQAVGVERLVRTMSRYRRLPAAERATFAGSLKDVLSTFGPRKVRNKGRVRRSEESANFGKLFRYESGKYAVEFHVQDADAPQLRAMDKTATDNLVRSVRTKMDRTRTFFWQLLKTQQVDRESFDRTLPTTLRIDAFQGGLQHFAEGNRGQITMGYKVLLNDYGLVASHETFHVIAQRILHSPRDRRFDFEAVEEGLADYYAAVANNQPRMGNPPSRWANRKISEAANAKKFAKARHPEHAFSQVVSGLLWQLRKRFNRRDKKAWNEVSYADRLALAAYRDHLEQIRPSGKARVRHWIDALVAADAQLSQGKNGELIKAVGRDFL